MCVCVLPLFISVRTEIGRARVLLGATQVTQRNEAELIEQKALLVLQLFVLNLEKHLETSEDL